MNRKQSPSPFAQKPLGGISALVLRCLALVFMLLDHLWATIVPGNAWMTYVGRLAFPIFAFQISEGFFHTSDQKKYLKRLLIFGLISEVPFDLVMSGSWLFPFHQNVMFTLLLGLLAIRTIEKARQARTGKQICLSALALLGYTLLALIGMVDYGVMGMWTVVLFYLCRGFSFAWLAQLVAMVLINVVWFEGQSLVLTLAGMTWYFPTQGFAVLALLPIWLYNGKKGSASRVIQQISYWFYPVHLLIIYLIAM